MFSASHICPQVANLRATWSFHLEHRKPAMPAPLLRALPLLSSPERMKDITRKVTKNISAVPKSLLNARHMTHKAEKHDEQYEVLGAEQSVKRRGADVDKRNPPTNSEGWIDMLPMNIRFFRAPYCSLPITSTAPRMSTDPSIAAAAGVWSLSCQDREATSREQKTQRRRQKTIIICLNISSGTDEAL